MKSRFPGCVIGAEAFDYINRCLRNDFYVEREHDEHE